MVMKLDQLVNGAINVGFGAAAVAVEGGKKVLDDLNTAAQRVLDELILARVRVMTAPERTAFLAHVRDIVDSVEDNVTSVPVESVEPDDAKDTEEAE